MSDPEWPLSMAGLPERLAEVAASRMVNAMFYATGGGQPAFAEDGERRAPFAIILDAIRQALEEAALGADARAERIKSRLDETEMERGERFAAEDIAHAIRRLKGGA